MSANLVRWGAIALMVGGAVSLVLGIIVASGGSRVAALLFTIVAGLFGAVGLVGLHALQQGRYGGLGEGALYTALVGIGAQVLAAVVTLLGSEALRWLDFPVGFLLLFVGLVLYGGAILQAGVMPLWYGIVLIITEPINFLLQQFGGIWIGLVFLVLGYVLWLRSGEATGPTQRPSRLR